MPTLRDPGSGIGCCSYSYGGCAACADSRLTRRSFLAGAPSLGALAIPAFSSTQFSTHRQGPIKHLLRVRPVFVYHIRERKEAATWRWTAEIHTEQVANEEKERIQRDLLGMSRQADFPLEILPLVSVTNKEEAAAVAGGNYDVLIMYASGHDRPVLDVLARPDRWNLIFVRHKSGPIYYMYIGVHPHFLRKTKDTYGQPGMDVDDVVVDSHTELLWRLRAFYALKNTTGKRIVAVGAAGGWGVDGEGAPERARQRWQWDIQTVPYPELEIRLRKAYQDETRMKRCREQAERYLQSENVTLETSKDFFYRALVVCDVFRDLLDEAQTDAITIGSCMHTILPVSRTTACLPLSLLNDEGYLAFCESDFVVIPSGVLLHYISGKPVFLCNASFPYNGIVTVSHCTAPRKMDGQTAAPARILTHYESDYGAAPKVEMEKGQVVTVINPDFAGKRWLGFRGEIRDNPFFPICRTQLEIGVHGNTTRMAWELKGFHWMLAYGDHMKETGYAVKKAGVEWFAVDN